MVLGLGAVVLVLGLPSVVRSRRAPQQLAVLLMLTLEFLLAAGLLRLAAADTFAALGVIAVTVAVRRLIGAALRVAARRSAPAAAG